MKLRNKKTGEITEANDWNIIGEYKTLAELTEEWEDAPEEEPKGIKNIMIEGDEVDIEFYDFKEAEEGFEKLKAWKRLKDGGITFKNWSINQTGTIDCFATWGDNIPPSRKDKTLLEDLDLLFGGEEPVHRESEETRSTEKEEM